MVQRPTYDDANLILRLYELRREERMRQARAWAGGKRALHRADAVGRIRKRAVGSAS